MGGGGRGAIKIEVGLGGGADFGYHSLNVYSVLVMLKKRT